MKHRLIFLGLLATSTVASAAEAQTKAPATSLDVMIDSTVRLISAKNVDELERRAQIWRGKNDVLTKSRDGQAMLMAITHAARRFYPHYPKAATHMMDVLATWEKSYPQSSVWRLLKSEHLARIPWGDHDHKDDVKSITEAEKLLREAEQVDRRTADWYPCMVTVAATAALVESRASSGGYRRPEWLKDWLSISEYGIKRFTSHCVIYFHIGSNLKVLGYPGTLEDWGLHVCRLVPKRGLEPYARLMWSLEWGYGKNIFHAPGYGDWPLARQGFFDMMANGWNTPFNLNNFLRLARHAEDRATVLQLLSLIGDNPDPEVFAIAAKFEEIKAWSAHKAPVIQPIWTTKARRLHSLAWGRDGKRLFVGTESTHLQVYDATSGTGLPPWEMQIEPQQINDILLSPDGRYLAAVSGYELSTRPGTCCIWDTQTEKVTAHFQAANGPLNVLSFSPDSSELITGGGLYSGPSEVWHWTRTTQAVPLTWAATHLHSIYALAWSPDARSVLFNCNNARLTVADDAREIRFVKQISTPALSNAAALAYSPDGTQVAAALRQTYFEKDKANGCIAIFNARDMTPRGDVLAPLTGGLSTLDYSPDGKFIATGGYDGFVYVLDTSTLVIKAWWNADHGILYKVRWSPDGKQIATAGSMDIVAVWPLKL